MKVFPTEILEALAPEPKIFGDAGRIFFESYNKRTSRQATGIDAEFVRDSHSRSRKGVLRSLNHQIRPAQSKLIRVIAGKVYDVAADLRHGTPFRSAEVFA